MVEQDREIVRTGPGTGPRTAAPPPAPAVRTIHDGVDECTDAVCCCEPEPRWQKVADERDERAAVPAPPSRAAQR